MNIWTDTGNVFSLKILASCYVTHTDVTWKLIDKKDFKIPGITGKLPVLEVKPGKYIFNHNTAMCYIFNQSGQASGLSGIEKEKVDELVEWDSLKLQPSSLSLLSSHILNPKEAPLSSESLTDVFTTLDTLLENKVYLLGPSFSVADVIIWGSLYGVMQLEDVKRSASRYLNVSKWFSGLSSMDSFRKAVDKVVGNEGISAFKPFFEGHNYSVFASRHGDKVSSNGESEEITLQQVEHAKQEWDKGRGDLKPRSYSHPILPKKGLKNILINSALPYVNNVPHLGNIIGCVLSADVYARFCRLRNYNSLFLCGTDEYGTATETKAIAEGVTPQEICDKYYRIHCDIYKWFNISFDYFGRTCTEQQTKIAQDIFWKIHKNGYLVEDNVDQLQCIQCNRFLADRFVEGTCPFCKFEDARGDQCDACGKLINAIELINPKCKQCRGSPQIKTSRHVFLDLPNIEPQLLNWLKKMEEENWTHNAKNITKGWIADGLKKRCITRDLKWGTPVPLEGFTDKVFYVWFDAPIGYISITANYTKEWEKWWKNPEEVKYLQFMAKDNVPFHSVVFPSSLIATKENYTLVSEIIATEYLNYEDDKFSKSRGVGVFGDHAESTGIPADIFRFYLVFMRPETNDSSFQWSDLVLKNNSELLNNFGNFVNRALMFLKNAFNSSMPELELTEEEYKLIASVNKDLISYIENLDKSKLRDALRCVLNITRTGNQYIQSNQPWVLAKGSGAERIRAGTVIGLSVNISALVAVLIHPYMPDISAQIQKQLLMPADRLVIPDYFVPMLPTGHKIGIPYPLFKKIEPALAEELRKRFSGTRSDTKEAKPKSGEHTNGSTDVTNQSNQGDPSKIAELTDLITQQGDVVRKAKGEKLSKDIIDSEVKKLLELKSKLAVLQGIDPKELQKGKKGKKK